MNNQEAYNEWSATYDMVENKTRDLEAKSLREVVFSDDIDILEIGCGTGKNTEFLQTKAKSLIAADFSEEMLAQAKTKIKAENVEFKQLDLREQWNLPENSVDIITCSLVLEHIENLDFVFAEAGKVLRGGGCFHLGELHPFKQYQGSKARFETITGMFELECFTHHVADYFAAAKRNGFHLTDLREYFDDDDKTQIPRILAMTFTNGK